MQGPESFDGLEEALVAAAELLLPVAEASLWPCRLELAAWLISIRDTFDPDRVIH